MKYNNTIRITIHILFWLFYMTVVFFFMPYYSDVELTWYQKIDFKLLIIVLTTTYLNEFVLLPKFFKKKLWLYLVVISLLLLFVTLFFCYYISSCSCSLSICLSQQMWKFLLPVFFLSLVWVLFMLVKKQKELEESTKERLEIELKFLKSQINPHVLFNNINTVYAQAVKGSDNVAEMILMLSENLKYILYQSEEKLVPLEKDIDFIDNYLAFQTLRTEGINKITFTKEVDTYNHQIAPLMLIGLIENAFKHSSYKEDALSEIAISLKISEGKLNFICTNEVDFDSGKRETEGFKIGLKNLRKRLELIYPARYSLEVNKSEDKFIAHLKIEL